ncbi:hypothetical protein G6F37_009067 [Rhizopus arrhizus]|nr:hypothetical protein G6F38_009099 [Rhizopus arrhizus]KAG1154862.1 hypothetical protein G6F37_009067 [Rhizopus arrhizus]
MGMLKSGSSVLSFDQLMAQATMVAKQQDAALLEKARQKRREDEEKRRREERVLKEKREAQELLARKREIQEKRQKQLVEQKKQQKRTEKMTKSRSVPRNSDTQLPNLSEKKQKPVHMSFEDLMKKAKEQSTIKKDNQQQSHQVTKKPSTGVTAPKASTSTPNLYHRSKRPETKSLYDGRDNSTLSVRERAKLMVSEPPKKVIGQKKDKRSIVELQRELRHAKGIYSDDEDERKKDPRLMVNKKPTQRYQSTSSDISNRKRPLSPPARIPIRKPEVTRRPLPSSIPRMPFTGRSLDRSTSRMPVPKRYREEEELDDELASFIVDDDDDSDRYYRGPRKNSYSDEISKIFRYDRSKYANEPIYSDDDMEANASEVLREEKRSERLAKREDLIEEQKELERLKKRKKTSA